MIKISYIYKIINIITGKIYIGQTTNLKDRLRHYRFADCKGQKLLYKSLKHYGWENHKFDIIYSVVCNKKELDDLEICFIKEFNSYYYDNNKYGLNLTKGGLLTMQAFEQKKEISIRSRKMWSERPHPNLGIKRDKKSVEKGKEKLCIEIHQYSLNGEFIKTWKSATHVEKELGFLKAKLGECAKGTRRTAYGFIWKYTEVIKSNNDIILKENRTLVSIVQLSQNNEFVKKWDSVKDILENLNVCRKSIYKCCVGTMKRAKGFKWMYATEYYKSKELLSNE